MFGLAWPDAVSRQAQVMTDLLMGKRCEVGMSTSFYGRSFEGEQSPGDLETAMQLVHRLFTALRQPDPSRLKTCMRSAP